MTTSRAPSLLRRAADHIAMQTSMLHRTPRQKSSLLDSWLLASSSEASILPAGVSGASTPDACTIAAKIAAPTRLPTKENASVLAPGRHPMVLRIAPCVRVIMFDVASSPPAE